MRRGLLLVSLIVALAAASGCRKSPPPPPADLAAAVECGDVAAASRFLNEGADPNRPNRVGRYPFAEAVARPNNAAVIKLLIQHGAKVDQPGQMSELADADITNMQCLIDAGADVNWPRGGKWTVLRVRVDRGADPKIIRFLLQHGADPNPPGDPLVLIAAKQKNDVAKLLLDAGATLGKDKGGEALALALRLGDDDLLHALLAHGADATWCDTAGNSLLMIAVQRPDAEILEDLIKAGADPTLANNLGQTPLWEVQRADIEIRLPLIRNGAQLISPAKVLAERKLNATGGGADACENIRRDY
ncbi:MAG TPA: ankyrin repeat domain-containing protein [Tepidisphaeraceae bacterium]|nr:ankyrin repeat domain-containing protein [Tepidisphaeraceae bacterium]